MSKFEDILYRMSASEPLKSITDCTFIRSSGSTIRVNSMACLGCAYFRGRNQKKKIVHCSFRNMHKRIKK